ncbi:MAG: dihydroorotase [Eubacterium sp.]|nr:dihydroorotase [Eubacterium sp.]
MKLLIKNGNVIDPATNTDEVLDVLVEDGVIKTVAPSISDDADQVINASGLVVAPGLIDMHVHFRDPGQTHKEDIKTGSKAAAKGGFTTVCCMPNTNPVIDSEETVKYIIDKASEEKYTNVLPVGAVTKGMKGEEITDIAALKEAGICAISEDGKSVMDEDVYSKAMAKAAELNVPVLAHCEEINLVKGGVMNADPNAGKLGLKGITNEVEDIIAQRDINLAEKLGTTLHLCHCSTKDSVEMLKVAKAKGVKVSGEVCPHHFTLTTDDIPSNDANFKMNPPLRTAEDRDALIKGLSEDILEVISTDHAPHSEEEKSKGFEGSPFGIVGLETSVGLTVTKLVKPGYITLKQMIEKMSYNPAKILGIDKGTLKEGSVADITIFDADEEYTVDKNDFESKGKNTPFDGYKLFGKVKYTILDGEIVYND